MHAVFPIGVPICIGLFLWTQREAIETRVGRKGGKELSTISFLFRSFSPMSWWVAIFGEYMYFGAPLHLPLQTPTAPTTPTTLTSAAQLWKTKIDLYRRLFSTSWLLVFDNKAAQIIFGELNVLI